MSYSISKRVDYSYDEALVKVTEALKGEGFGILTEVDVKATLKKKLDVDFKPYKILGACNPPYAYEVLSLEEQIGLSLPCNVVVFVNDSGETIVAAIDPVTSLGGATPNQKVKEIAAEVREKLKKVIENL